MPKPRGSVVRAKRALRAALAQRRAAMTAEERARASHAACAALLASPWWADASAVALFHSMPHEVSTVALMEACWSSGRSVALPVTPRLGQPLQFRWVTEHTPLVRAHYGALEPGPTAAAAPHDEIGLVVTPGLGFDERGARLGYGGGYYDRTLGLTSGSAVMLAFDGQRVPRIPEEPHDARVAAIATDAGLTVPTGTP